MDVLNLNQHPVSVKLRAPDGSVDYATVAKGRRVSIPADHVVDNNWLAQQKKVKTYADDKSKTPLELSTFKLQTASKPVQTAQRIVAVAAAAAAAPAPASTPNTDAKA